MKIAIIGGGVSGLAAAYFLGKKGHKVSLFEKGNTLGGLASYFPYQNTYIDKYYHFICGEDKSYVNLLRELSMHHKIKSRITKMGYFCQDKIFSISTPFNLLFFSPLSLPLRIRYLYSLLQLRVKKDEKNLDEISSYEFLQKLSGEKIYQTIWKPTLYGKFGNYFQDISASWVLQRIKRVVTSRMLFGIFENIRYLDGGTKEFIDKMEKEILSFSGTIFKNTEVEKILIKQGEACGVRTKEQKYDFDKVISCVPAPLFLKMLDERVFPSLLKIKYLGVICATIILKRPLTKYFWLNLNSPDIPFVNLVDYTNLNQHQIKKIIYIPEYLPTEGERFKISEEKLKLDYFSCLQKINPTFKEEDVENFSVFRDAYAQPVCTVGFSKLVPPYKSPIKNLYLLEQSQLYPSDRTVSGSIDIAYKLTKQI